MLCALLLALDRYSNKKVAHIDMFTNKKLYHTCFTRKNDGTCVLVDLDKGEKCISGMTEQRFWDKQIYDELKRA